MGTTNLPEWGRLFFACARIRAVLVTVNTGLKAAEIGYLLRQSGTSVLFMIPAFRTLDSVRELSLAGETPSLRHVVMLRGESPGALAGGPAQPPSRLMVSWAEFLEGEADLLEVPTDH